MLFNKTRIFNKERLEHLVVNRPKNQPLLTISNHYSCFDDPGLFGCLKLRNVCSNTRIRWSVAAHDICFTNKVHSSFFMFGKCIPVIRGEGGESNYFILLFNHTINIICNPLVYQPAIDLCIQKLKLGEWVSFLKCKNLLFKFI